MNVTGGRLGVAGGAAGVATDVGVPLLTCCDTAVADGHSCRTTFALTACPPCEPEALDEPLQAASASTAMSNVKALVHRQVRLTVRFVIPIHHSPAPAS